MSEHGFDASLAPLIIAFPATSATLLLFFGRRLGRISGWVATGAVAASFLVGLVLFTTMLGAEAEHEHNMRRAAVTLFDWIRVGDFSAGAGLLVDQLSMTMALRRTSAPTAPTVNISPASARK